MKINVIKRFRCAEDGVTVKTYPVGVHHVSEHVAAIALHNGWAEKVQKPKFKRKSAS